MHLSETMKNKFATLRSHLTSLDSQPLGKAALVVILFLDLFILSSIFDGLDKHTRQLSSPDDFIPPSCREMVINRDWNPTTRTDNLADILLTYHDSYYPLEERQRGRHPVCAPYLDLLEQMKNDKGLLTLFEERGIMSREATDIQRKIGNLQGAYDTSLLESIADQKAGQANVDTIKRDVQGKTSAFNTLRGQIETLEQKIIGDGKVKLLWEKLATLAPADRETLKSDLRAMYFWHPVKSLAMQMIFLLPLLAVFTLWNSASLRRGRGIQALVSSHLVVVSFIPIFFKIIETVYDIIPKKLLKKFIELLESLKLIAIWHYLVIALAVAVALCLIYLFQKKVFSWDKLVERRIAKGLCHECGKHLPADSRACPSCGSAQFKDCGACKQPTLVHGKYCKYCGKEQ